MNLGFKHKKGGVAGITDKPARKILTWRVRNHENFFKSDIQLLIKENCYSNFKTTVKRDCNCNWFVLYCLL